MFVLSFQLLYFYFVLIVCFCIFQGYEESIYNKLKNVSKTLGSFKVYKKTEMPSRWHFTNNNRIPPIYVVAEDGYGFQDLTESVVKWAPVHGIKGTIITY